jgi:hypothetical protein
MRARRSSGKSAEIIAVPPGAKPAWPMPTTARTAKICPKLRVIAHHAVASPQITAIRPMPFLRLQRSINSEDGSENARIDQYTAETNNPHCMSLSPQSRFRAGNSDTITTRST